MTDKEINTNKYFVERTDIGGGTIGYTVPFPEELLREIIKQNKQLKRKEQECEELKEECEEHRSNAESYCKSYQYSCVVNGKITDKALKYKQALDEIKSICNKTCEVCQIFRKCDKEYSTCKNARIIDVINKAKGE